MKSIHSKLAKSLIVVAAVGALVASSTVSFAATKSITCYKGTTVKKVTTAKCPTGFSTTAPKTVASHPSVLGMILGLVAMLILSIGMGWARWRRPAHLQHLR